MQSALTAQGALRPGHGYRESAWRWWTDPRVIRLGGQLCALAALGDPILGSGLARYCQTCYTDPNANLRPSPTGNAWNVTNGLIVSW